MRLICYCAGGLGNRLRALSSCYSLSSITNRELCIIWEPALRCISRFKDLYSNDLNLMSKEELLNLQNYNLYGLHSSIYNELHLNGNPELIMMAQKQGFIDLSDYQNQLLVSSDSTDDVVIITNNFVAGADLSVEKNFLSNVLTPNQEILGKIQQEQQYLNLNKTVVGVHARGTDFNTPTSFYIDQMTQIDTDKFFVCSDSLEVELEIKERFKEKIILRNSKEYVSKENPNASWDDNVKTPLGSLKDAVVDMHLLAKTNFLVYNNLSTFSDIVRKMQ